jgi:hypothetical protein
MIKHKLNIDNNYVKQLYEEIYERLQDIKKNPKLSSEHQNWAKKICERKYKLIPNLTYLFEQKDISFKEKEMIITILNSILSLNQNISNQIIKFCHLDKEIIEFILLYKKEFKIIHLYSINVLSYIYNINNIISVINGTLIEILFNSLKIIEEQNILENIIYMLIEINFSYKKLEHNDFIEEFHRNSHSNLIIEIILVFLNREKDMNKLNKILICLRNVYDKEKKDIIISKDLETFIDIALRHFETCDDNNIIIGFLNIFIRITKYDAFYNIMYKTKDLQDILDEYINSNKVSEIIKTKSGKILRTIVKHLKLQLFLKTNYHGISMDQFDDDIDGIEEEEESEEDKEED